MIIHASGRGGGQESTLGGGGRFDTGVLKLEREVDDVEAKVVINGIPFVVEELEERMVVADELEILAEVVITDTSALVIVVVTVEPTLVVVMAGG
jgi:hypothetical protein